MFLRPQLHTSYRAETAMLPTWTQRAAMTLLAVVAVLLPFNLPVVRHIPIIGFVGSPTWIRLTTVAVIFCIAALGLNLLTGVAGQVSLGHAFFMGVGAYASVYLGGEAGSRVWGHSLPMWIWLPGAGVAAALVGIIVAPAAVRVRGLYLAIITVGLVFIGIHLSNVIPEISGEPEIGRNFQRLEWRWWKEEDPLISFASDGHWLWFDVTRAQKTYLLAVVLLAIAVLVAKNLHRTRTGRALQAIRDRDVAAEVMGVPEVKYKLIAFAISSFFAGVAGALFASFVGRIPPETWSIFLSVEFIAIILIGGAGTTAGALLGTFFVVLLPRFIEDFVHWMSTQASGDGWVGGLWATFWDFFVSAGSGDFGFVSDAQIAPGLALPSSAIDAVFYGALVVIFLLFEPRGLFGIWLRIRNYWKGWPFTY